MMKRRAFAILVLLLCSFSTRAEDDKSSNLAKEPELRLELLRRVKDDQDARNAWIAWMKEHGENGTVKLDKLSAELKKEHEKLGDAVKKADLENTDRLGQIVEKHGWPSNSLVGKDGSHAAWLLVQHADANTKFQRKCLDLMSKLPKDEVSQTDLAYLTDRVLLAEGKKQIYGTQFTFSDGKWQPRPLDEPDNVDKRRAEVGLKSLADYVKDLQSVYGGGPKK
jgi:hypothetical protein